VACDGLCGC
jgi:hypothetical protein